jgi:DNA-binding NarL/FixJ family response regulator
MNSTKVIRILTVDDHPVFRAGIAAMVANEPDMTIVGEASTGSQAVAIFHDLRPDITLLDLQMPEMNGIDAILAIRKVHLSARIIVLTTYDGDVRAERALKAGAQAYLLKGMIRKELLDTIRAVQRGQKKVCPDVAVQLAHHMGEDSLSKRETEVLKLVAVGNTDKRIAGCLSISEETAKGHLKSILQKLGANNRTHAVALSFTRGIIQF